MTEEGSGIFREAVLIVADALGVELDDIRCEAEYAQTTEDLHLPGDWLHRQRLRRGNRCPVEGHTSVSATSSRSRAVWTKGQSLEPTWEMGFGYHVTVEGRPTIKTTLAFEPPPDFVGETIEDYILLGLTITAVPGDHRDPRRHRRTAWHRDVQRPTAAATPRCSPCLTRHIE